MKTVIITSILVLGFTAHAASKAQSQSLSLKSDSVITTNLNTAKPTAAESNNVVLRTNIAQMAQGNGNINADLMQTEKAALNISVATASAKEEVQHNGIKSKQPVTRTAYAVGASFYLNPITSKNNLVLSPAIAFGQTQDNQEVTQQSGLNIRATGLVSISKNLIGEAGIEVNNLKDGEFKGNPVLGLGYVF